MHARHCQMPPYFIWGQHLLVQAIGLSLLSLILQMLRIGEMALCLIPLFWFLQAILIWILDASSYNIMTWYYAYFSILRLASQSVPLNHINLKCHEIYSQPSLIQPLPCTGQKAGWRGCRINEVEAGLLVRNDWMTHAAHSTIFCLAWNAFSREIKPTHLEGVKARKRFTPRFIIWIVHMTCE